MRHRWLRARWLNLVNCANQRTKRTSVNLCRVTYALKVEQMLVVARTEEAAQVRVVILCLRDAGSRLLTVGGRYIRQPAQSRHQPVNHYRSIEAKHTPVEGATAVVGQHGSAQSMWQCDAATTK